MLGPKADGLDALLRLTRDDPLDFLLLFSSVCAAMPALSAGVADYAAANAYLDYQADGLARAGRARIHAVNWPVWQGSGESPEACARLGLGTLPAEQGLAVLDQVMALPPGVTVVLPCPEPPGALDETRLLIANRGAGAVAAADGTAPSPDGEPGDHASQEPGPPGWLVRLFSGVLGIPEAELDPAASFAELGVESVLLGVLLQRIEAHLGRSLEPAVLLDHPTLDSLGAHLGLLGGPPAAEPPALSSARARASRSAAARNGDEIAVIGMACRFPGAPDLEAYWRLLRHGECAVREVPASRWDTEALYAPEGDPGRSVSKWGGILDGIEDFDPGFFGLTDQDATALDPAIRLMLEATASCLRDAGYRDQEVAGREVGIFAGARMSSYRRRIGTARAASGSGGDQNFIAARIAHEFDLCGPNLVVDSACSSALVSIQLACRSLLAGDAEMALAGGVEVLLDEEPYVEFTAARALSPRGRCATFARDADGFVPGEGCGVVLLKPLASALADGDRIHAVINAVAVGNDGRTMGLTTPNPAAQSQVIRKALERARLSARDIGLLEAHGTATIIGDPIELRALTEVYREHTSDIGYCAIGSVKSNIGHLLSAAGAAGVIKALLALEHAEIPATLFCDDPNPRFDFASSPFFPIRATRPWTASDRAAGVSAFGLGGTNAHLIATAFDGAFDGAGIASRPPLPPPVFQRRRLWLDREPGPAPRSDHRNGRRLVASVLDLTFAGAL